MDQNPIIPLRLDALTILSIIGSIELANRHPDNTGITSQRAGAAARMLATILYEHTNTIPEYLATAWRQAGILALQLFFIITVLAASTVPAYAIDVTLAWDPITDPGLNHYTLYQADRFDDKTGPWQKIQDVAGDETTVTVTVDDSKNHAWYVTASDNNGNQSGPSNMVELYDHTPPPRPDNLHKPDS